MLRGITRINFSVIVDDCAFAYRNEVDAMQESTRLISVRRASAEAPTDGSDGGGACSVHHRYVPDRGGVGAVQPVCGGGGHAAQHPEDVNLPVPL